MRLLVLIFALLPTAALGQGVSFPGITVGNSAAGPEIKAWVYKPAGAGPFPAIVLAHSCAGVTEHTHGWARKLAGWGYLVLEFDSFNPRGTKAVCTTPRAVTPNMRIADVAGGLDYLATRPDVVRGRVGVIGHSHGGGVAIRSTQKQFDLASRGLRGGVAYYPGCNPAFDLEVAVPLLILAGDKDDWTPADRCRQVVAAAARRELIDAVFYPNAYHSFDVMTRNRTVAGSGGRMHHLAYDPAAAPDAEARTRAFFERILR